MVVHDEAAATPVGRGGRPPSSAWSPLRFQGRLRRSDYIFLIVGWHLLSVLAAAVAMLVVLVPLSLVAGSSVLGGAALVVGVVAIAAYAVGAASYGARRLHDMGRSARWLLLGLVPVVGLGLFVALVAVEGTQGPNAYGAREEAGLLETRLASANLPTAVPAEVVAAQKEEAFDEGRRFAERDRQGSPSR